jgi:hypothetical protein
MKDKGLSASIYGMGFIGTAVYFVGHAPTFWLGALAYSDELDHRFRKVPTTRSENARPSLPRRAIDRTRVIWNRTRAIIGLTYDRDGLPF